MTPFPWTDVLIIIGLILLNGLFSMSELAIVSARTPRLKMSADKGSRAALTAMELAADPGRFLSTVQIGITLIGSQRAIPWLTVMRGRTGECR